MNVNESKRVKKSAAKTRLKGVVMKNFLQGMGSTLNIFPSTDYREFTDKSAEDRLEIAWHRVGETIRQEMRALEPQLPSGVAKEMKASVLPKDQQFSKLVVCRGKVRVRRSKEIRYASKIRVEVVVDKMASV